MKYLKLFESWIDNPKFYRKSHGDILGGSNEGEFQPTQRERMIGAPEINDDLVKKGFPDKKNCIHFMDQEAFDSFGKSMSNVWGDYLYQVMVDDKSIIAWSFLLNINDWYYKSVPYDNNSRRSSLIQDLEATTEYADLDYYDHYEEDRNYEVLPLMTEILIDKQIIGFGTIDDLKKSKNYGKYRLFAWTNDKVYLKNIK